MEHITEITKAAEDTVEQVKALREEIRTYNQLLLDILRAIERQVRFRR